MTAAELIDALTGSLGTVYPARVAEVSNRPGTVTCVVTVDRVDYEPTMCDPVPATVTATVTVLAATGGEQGVRDLLTRLEPVTGLIRAAGFTPTTAEPGSADDHPALLITATAQGEG